MQDNFPTSADRETSLNYFTFTVEEEDARRLLGMETGNMKKNLDPDETLNRAFSLQRLCDH